MTIDKKSKKESNNFANLIKIIIIIGNLHEVIMGKLNYAQLHLKFVMIAKCDNLNYYQTIH